MLYVSTNFVPKKQLRRCANCQKVGHNRSTCSTLPPEPVSPRKTTATPLKFFVHHVTHAPTPSPHIVDLKKGRSPLWDQIETAAPIRTGTLYQDYHNVPTPPDGQSSLTQQPDSKVPSFSGLHPTITRIATILGSLKKITSKIDNAVQSLHNHLVARRIKKAATKDLLEKTFLPKLTKPPLELPDFRTIFSHFIPTKGLSATAVLLLIMLIVPGPAKSYYNQLENIKTTIASQGLAGFMALQDSAVALRQANLSDAEKATEHALTTFNNALTILGEHTVLDTLAKMIPTVRGEVQSREHILFAGQEIALGNSYLLQNLTAASVSTASSTLFKRVNMVIASVKTALPNYQRALSRLNAVDQNTLPLEYQNQFADYKTLFSNLVHDSESLTDLGSAINEIFGGNGSRRYLLVFQNPSELRPTGGFMGSFAIIDIKNGELVNLEVPPGGTYDVQGQLRDHVIPPTPLLLSNKRWEFQDANWFPDFPTSAKKIIWFYAHSRRVSTDGVIVINSSVLERILRVLGPITDDKRALTLDATSALPTLQQIVEEGPEKKLDKPKQVLTDLAPQFLEALKHVPENKVLALLTNASEALKQKEIQAYFTDKITEDSLRSFGWAGHIIDTRPNQDYLFVVNTNIQGQKSDAKIHQTISHQAVVASDGSIIDNVVITREHTGAPNEKLYGQTNIDFLRLYVPKGSTLLSAGGFTWPEEKSFRVPDAWSIKDQFLAAHQKEIGIDQNSGTTITEESNKTVFGNWVITEPGQVSQVQFTYRLPFTLEDMMAPNQNRPSWQKILDPINTKALSRYQLIVQKQSGITADFESQIIFPELWHPTWESDETLQLAKNGAVITKQPLENDSVWGLLMQK